MNSIVKILATLGLGLLPKAPGTWGTLAGIPIYWLISDYSSTDKAIVLVLIFILGWLVCSAYSRMAARHDSSEVVIDEVVGYLLAAVWFDFSYIAVVMSFIAFRVFDIFKPWPISFVDRRLYSGFGMMFDDVLAGLAAGAVVWGLFMLTGFIS